MTTRSDVSAAAGRDVRARSALGGVRDLGRGSELEPHLPLGRLPDGGWLFAPLGEVLVVLGGERVVCHACGEHLSAVSAGHLKGHGLDLAGYRERFGLNRKTSLLSPALAEKRRVEGLRRWRSNVGVRDGLAVGQQMARDGLLYGLGAAAQPAGSRRRQGRSAASRAGASPALRAYRVAQTEAGLVRWAGRAQGLGFADLEAYLAVRRREGASAHRVRTELGCGGTVAERLLRASAGEGAGADV